MYGSEIKWVDQSNIQSNRAFKTWIIFSNTHIYLYYFLIISVIDQRLRPGRGRISAFVIRSRCYPEHSEDIDSSRLARISIQASIRYGPNRNPSSSNSKLCKPEAKPGLKFNNQMGPRVLILPSFSNNRNNRGVWHELEGVPRGVM